VKVGGTMKRRTILATMALLAAVLTQGCAAATDEGEGQSGEEQLVGGTAESRWLASGYLTRTDGSTGALCGATLIAPNVAVTAAHCLHRHRHQALSFGVGEISAKNRYGVQEIHYHPKAHLERQGMIDLANALLLHDLAYVVLDEPVPGVVPAQIAAHRPMGCGLRLVGYGQDWDEVTIRKSVEGCVVLNTTIHGDAIVEVRPKMGGAVCHRDGDEGHALLQPNDTGAPMLVGIYVGSVTQVATDCTRYVQFLNGYEAIAGHREFLEEGLRRGKLVLSQ
jgi:hypothetical protein